MPNHAYRAASAPSVVQRARNTRTGRKLERGGYLTVETVTMWIVYALTLIGNAVIEGGRVGGTTSADIAYGVFTWFTPAGYVFAIWSLIYVAMVVWPRKRRSSSAISKPFDVRHITCRRARASSFCASAVSYTHLDVYKRQYQLNCGGIGFKIDVKSCSACLGGGKHTAQHQKETQNRKELFFHGTFASNVI